MAMNFRMSAKSARQLGVRLPLETSPIDNVYTDWSVVPFAQDNGTPYICMINTKSCYAVLFRSYGLSDGTAFARMACQAIRAHLVFFGLRDLYNEKIEPHTDAFRFSRPYDRSISAYATMTVHAFGVANLESTTTIPDFCFMQNSGLLGYSTITAMQSPDDRLVRYYESDRTGPPRA